MTTGEKIAILRKRKEITQEQLAEQLEVSRQSISRWESDAAFPEIGKLVKLSKILDCSIDFLVNESVNVNNETDISTSLYDCYKFIRECGCFFLATSVDNQPRVRPMGWMYSDGKGLFIATDKRKSVYSDLTKNARVEIASYNMYAGRWIRISGAVEKEGSQAIREEMNAMYPMMKQIFNNKVGLYLSIFRVNVENITIN